MKKILCSFFITIFFVFGLSYAADNENSARQGNSSNEYQPKSENTSYKNMQDWIDNLKEEFAEPYVKFIKKLETCTPAKFEYDNLKLAIYGKTKNGKCHFADMVTYHGVNHPVQCMLPMSAAVGISTTLQDYFDTSYTDKFPELKEQRKEQFQEIYKASHDYCNYKAVIKKSKQ